MADFNNLVPKLLPTTMSTDSSSTLAKADTKILALDTSLPGARSVKVDGEVFLGGNFIELGISSLGDFGTLGNKPDDFFGTDARTNIGMSVDRDGFGIGEDFRADIFFTWYTRRTFCSRLYKRRKYIYRIK